MEKDKDFNFVLNNAKKLGFAESNPSSDLNGDDVAAKLKFYHLYVLIHLLITLFMLKYIEKEDITNANNLGYKVKLLGFSELIGNKIYQRVHPTLINKSSYVASIDGVLNAVIIDGSPVGQSIIQGEGAGPAATTSALISDISSILEEILNFHFLFQVKKEKN